MCQDIEGLARGKLSLPEMPTVETAKRGQNIEYDREKTWDNVHNAIIFATNAKKAYKKNFDDVDTESEDYYTLLSKHAKGLDELDKFSNSLSELFDAAKSLDDGTIPKISKVRETLNLPKTDNNQFQNPQTYPIGYNFLNNENSEFLMNLVDEINSLSAYNGTPTGFAADMKKIKNGPTVHQEAYLNENEVNEISINELNERIYNLKNDILSVKSKIYLIYKNPYAIRQTRIVAPIKDMRQLIINLDNTKIYVEKFDNEKLSKQDKEKVKRIENTLEEYTKDLYGYILDEKRAIILLKNNLPESKQKSSELIRLEKGVFSLEKLFMNEISYILDKQDIENVQKIYIKQKEDDKKHPRLSVNTPQLEKKVDRYEKNSQNLQMDEINQKIYEYSYTHLYDSDNNTTLKLFLAGAEGCKNKAYQDQGGIWTIGCGHIKNVKPQDYISNQQIDNYFQDDIKEHKNYVYSLVKVPLSQNQYDALVSLCFNEGPGNLKNARIFEYLNKGDYIKASQQFKILTGVKNNKTGEYIISNGLKKRRKEEFDLFWKDLPNLKPNY